MSKSVTIYGPNGQIVSGGPPTQPKKVHLTKQIKHSKEHKDTVPVEQRLSKEQLEHLYNCIHFTKTIMAVEAQKRLLADEGTEVN